MAETPDRLGNLPLLQAGTSFPLYVHNEAIEQLAVFAIGGVLEIRNTPPSSPSEGDAYIVGTSPTGVWVGFANAIAIWQNNSWSIKNPSQGWNIFLNSSPVDLLYFDGSNWSSVSSVGGGLTSATNLGTGVGIYASILDEELRLKSLKAGSNVILTPSATEITIDAQGAINTVSNLGAGEGIYSTIEEDDLQLKSIVAGSGVSVSSTPTEITIATQTATHQKVSTNTQTLSGNLTLTNTSGNYQFLDPGGANRDVILPAAEAGLFFEIWNLDLNSKLFIKKNNGNLLTTLVGVEGGIRLICGGSDWYGKLF